MAMSMPNIESNQSMRDEGMKPLLMITGMHRSGTSFLARALNLCGMYLGNPSSLMSTDWRFLPDNLRGHWEHRRLYELAEETLAISGGSWDNPPVAVKVTPQIGNEVTKQIKELMAHPALAAGFKDPRIILCLDSWLPYLPNQFYIVAIFRHPNAVAESLRRRNLFSFDKSIALWKYYNKKLLLMLDKFDGFLLNFDLQKEELLKAVSKVCRNVGLLDDIDLSNWYTKELITSGSIYDLALISDKEARQIYSQLLELSKRPKASSLVLERSIEDMRNIIRGLLQYIQSEGDYFKSINDENLTIIKEKMKQIDDLNRLVFSIENSMIELKEFRSYEDFHVYQRTISNSRLVFEDAICAPYRNEQYWYYQGYCQVCKKQSDFLIDWLFSYNNRPNYRERLVCTGCGLTNRQRFIISRVNEFDSINGNINDIYMYEAVTPFYSYVRRQYDRMRVIGSEYFGSGKTSGEIINGVRHEDATALSFSDNSFDIIISNDVYEHVPDIHKSLKEAYRVLRPSGRLLMTILFWSSDRFTKRRARLNEDGSISDLLPPVYHANPVSEKGSLVYYDYGWDFLDYCKSAGFKDAYALGYYSVACGYLGNGIQLMFIAIK